MEKLKYIQKILINQGINVSNINEKVLEHFIQSPEVNKELDTILSSKKNIMKKWEITSKINEFENIQILIPNGIHNKNYEFNFDKNILKDNHLTDFQVNIPEVLGLTYDKDEMKISGSPKESGEFKIRLNFKVVGQTETDSFNEKIVNLIINPDPKSLWKNIESDKNAPFWKEDNDSSFVDLDNKKIVVSSKRGRSHQNVGSFRDDDFATHHFKKTGWTVVAVSDGAGSAKFSRKGSQIACQETISYFKEKISLRDFISFERKIEEFEKTKDEELLKELEIESKKGLYKVVVHTHSKIKEIADKTFEDTPEIFGDSDKKHPIEHFHATLIFCAFKKFDFGYLFLTFSVGDCPIGIVNKDQSDAKMLNWLDVGEFGGGTRFITEAGIFHSQQRPVGSRFNFHIQSDFSYLFLMTDGIYDAKFEVEANLEKIEKWNEFISDLEGSNEDNTSVKFTEDEKIEESLNKWMDFWSKGNHDDRTLAIIY